MAIYEYLCPGCGRCDVNLPMGTAPVFRDCPGCGRPARRVYSAPNLRRVDPGLAGALAREEQSREAPAVVSNAPGRRRPHPALGRLPRG
jgi:putative FmdB family regulatory protein